MNLSKNMIFCHFYCQVQEPSLDLATDFAMWRIGTQISLHTTPSKESNQRDCDSGSDSDSSRQQSPLWKAWWFQSCTTLRSVLASDTQSLLETPAWSTLVGQPHIAREDKSCLTLALSARLPQGYDRHPEAFSQSDTISESLAKYSGCVVHKKFIYHIYSCMQNKSYCGSIFGGELHHWGVCCTCAHHCRPAAMSPTSQDCPTYHWYKWLRLSVYSEAWSTPVTTITGQSPMTLTTGCTFFS